MVLHKTGDYLIFVPICYFSEKAVFIKRSIHWGKYGYYLAFVKESTIAGLIKDFKEIT